MAITPFDYQPRTRTVFGRGTTDRIAELAQQLGFRRTLLVADPGLVEAGHVARVTTLLEDADIAVFPFHDFGPDPDTDAVETARAFAAPHAVDSIVGLGGGSSMDCAKGANFLLTNGGRMHDYRGFGKATRPMLPSIGMPTTAGTGSEAQIWAVIADAATHVKMACGDPQSAFQVAVLDPDLTLSQPAAVTAVSGFDAISHVVESFVTTRRTSMSICFARQAWSLLTASYLRVLHHPSDIDARSRMLLGAHYAGMAIEQSMLGAAHACANPLTAHHGVPHGRALAVLLPHVVKWNATEVDGLYGELLAEVGRDMTDGHDGHGLAMYLGELAESAGLATTLRGVGVPEADFGALAHEASEQMTGRFNPRRFDAVAAERIYRWAL